MMVQTDANMGTAKQDQRDVGLCGVKSFGYFGLRHRPGQTSDLGDIFGCQESLEEGDETDVDGVLFVAPVIGPFEIGDRIVRFNTVSVVDHRKVVGIGDEGETDKSMNMDGLALSLSEEIDVSIAKFVGAGAQNLSIDPSRSQAIADAIKAPHATEVTNLVKVSEIGDCDGSPLFCENDIHVMGCPSGNVGSAIKDPSHASTFGGSAMMASATGIYNGRI